MIIRWMNLKIQTINELSQINRKYQLCLIIIYMGNRLRGMVSSSQVPSSVDGVAPVVALEPITAPFDPTSGGWDIV